MQTFSFPPSVYLFRFALSNFTQKQKTKKTKQKPSLKFNLHLIGEGTTLTDIKKKKKKESKIKTAIGLSRIMIITKIIYLYIRQKNVLSTNLWNKNKSQKKPHLEI